LEFIQNVDIKKLSLIKKTIELNMKISLEGLKRPYGLCVGRSIKNNMETGFLADDILKLCNGINSSRIRC
jgi:L-cysteine desulfidase